jgi:hypothetical protein
MTIKLRRGVFETEVADVAEVRERLARGKVLPTDEVYDELLDVWRPVAEGIDIGTQPPSVDAGLADGRESQPTLAGPSAVDATETAAKPGSEPSSPQRLDSPHPGPSSGKHSRPWLWVLAPILLVSGVSAVAIFVDRTQSPTASPAATGSSRPALPAPQTIAPAGRREASPGPYRAPSPTAPPAATGSSRPTPPQPQAIAPGRRETATQPCSQPLCGSRCCMPGTACCRDNCYGACPQGLERADDCQCHVPCGSGVCDPPRICCGGTCWEPCPRGQVLVDDCRCHPRCGSTICDPPRICCDGTCWEPCPPGQVLVEDCRCHPRCGSDYCDAPSQCCGGTCYRPCAVGEVRGSDCACHRRSSRSTTTGVVTRGNTTR